MRLLVIAYSLVYLALAVWGVPKLLRESKSLWHKVALLAETVFWFAGLLCFLLSAPAGLRIPGQILFFLALAFTAFGHAIDYLEDPSDPELTPSQNRLSAVVGWFVGVAIDLPGILVTLHYLWKGFPLPALVLAIATFAGSSALTLLLASRRATSVQGQDALQEYLSSPLEYGRPPDELRFVASHVESFPGFDGPVSTSLFAFRYGQTWNVGFVGPVVFAFAGKDLDPDRPAEAYSEFRSWFEQEHIASLAREGHSGAS